MKICHITSVHSSKDGRIFYKECTSLAKRGYDVYLVAPGESRFENGVTVIGIGDVPKSRIKRMLLFSKKAYKAALRINADVYHLHDPELLPYAKKLKRKRKKVIFDSHENTLEQMSEKAWIPKPFRRIVSSIYRHYATKVFRRVDALISVTPHIVDMLRKINPNSYMVTNYPIVLDEQSAINVRNNVHKSEFVLCFTGGISHSWCHDTIIECLSAVPDCKYVLCGKADEVYLSQLKNMDNWIMVDYLGEVRKDEAIDIQTAASVGMALLSPSANTDGKNGTIGNTKIFEYMSAAIPIVCTNFILWKEIVDKYNCGICVSPDNREEIIKALNYLKSNPDVAKNMGQNGRTAVMNIYNWKTQENVLTELYGKLEDV